MLGAESRADPEVCSYRRASVLLRGQRWRLIPLEIGDSQDHMRVTDALVRTAAQRRPTVWWHCTETPTILVGRGIGLRNGAVNSDIRVIPRPTGGGAVLAGPGVLGLDIAMPANYELLTGDIVRDYRWLGETWSIALSRLGLEANPLTIEDCRRPFTGDESNEDLRLVCFGTFSPFEVTVAGRKVVGLSQVRRQAGVLFSSAVHLSADPGDIVEVLPLSKSRRGRLRSELSRRASNLNSLASGTISAVQLMEMFRLALKDTLDVRLRKGTWSKRELQRIGRLP